MGKKDEDGNIVTAPEALKALYLRTYKNRLQNKPMKTELLDIFFLKDELWKSRMQELKNVKTKISSGQQLKALRRIKHQIPMEL